MDVSVAVLVELIGIYRFPAGFGGGGEPTGRYM